MVAMARYTGSMIRNVLSSTLAGAAVVLAGMPAIAPEIPVVWLVGAGVAAVASSMIALGSSKKISLSAPSVSKNVAEGALVVEFFKKNALNLQHALEVPSAA